MSKLRTPVPQKKKNFHGTVHRQRLTKHLRTRIYGQQNNWLSITTEPGKSWHCIHI